ncbi:MAG: hypothetical protein L0Y39_03785 [Methylococcaceae bacterium]|nr:hypothetical protein [Methylococcaceae bacterium]
MSRLPPFGKHLAERRAFQNLPFLVIVCAGKDAWKRARRWNLSPNDCMGLVWPGDRPPIAYQWPVSNCRVVVEWDTGPSPEQITGLIRVLLASGASTVVSCPLFIDPETPAWIYDADCPLGERWVQVREVVQVFPGGNFEGSRRVA